MRQAKRLFYIVLLNIIISAITIGVILQLWERDHPLVAGENTPVFIMITQTGSAETPMTTGDQNPATPAPTDAGVQLLEIAQPTPTIKMLVYQVKEGDTLGALSVEFNISVADLMTANNLPDPDSISVGQLLYIPTAPLPKATFTPIPVTLEVSPTSRPTTTSTQGPTPTATATSQVEEAQVVIDKVIGAGSLENERVVLRRTGDGELSLAGWRITDSTGHEYIFPQLTLYKDGAINLNTRRGQDTVVDLFWGLSSPIWSSGKTVSLLDPQDYLRAPYKIP
jgi:LysM repeat protein